VSLDRSKRLGGLALAAGLLVAACSSGSGATTAPTAAAPTAAAPSTAASPGGSAEASPGGSAAGGAITGSINVSGSSTVEPISTSIAEALKAANPDFNYTIEGPGTGDGFKRFCNGETDISDASRKIKDEEAALCQAAGIEYVELAIAYDGLTVMTNPADADVTCLSFADLYALIGPESTGFAKWSDAAALAKELGSNTTFPDTDLAITGPGEESGTYDSFVELVLDGIAKTRNQVASGASHTTTRPDYTSSGNDNVIVEGITSSPGSLGWVGFGFAEENKDKIKILGVSKDPNGTCIMPDATTISDGSYPISRTLYIYVNKAKAASNPAVSAYVDYYLADGTISTALETVPYINLPADKLAASLATWQSSK
jgi:phosphate transport system substrate-binding protein